MNFWQSSHTNAYFKKREKKCQLNFEIKNGDKNKNVSNQFVKNANQDHDDKSQQPWKMIHFGAKIWFLPNFWAIFVTLIFRVFVQYQKIKFVRKNQLPYKITKFRQKENTQKRQTHKIMFEVK